MTLPIPVATPDPLGYKVDISRGQRIGRVSSEWFSRPDDERYLSLSELYEAVRARAEVASARTVETRAIRVEATTDNPERLSLLLPDRQDPVAPTHWSFGQLCSLVGAPSSYLRQLPAALAGINMQHGLLAHRGELVKTLETGDGRTELRAVTGPDYGRIWDHELVSAVMKIAGNGTGDTRWKVPGTLDWSSMRHNPFVEVTKIADPDLAHIGPRLTRRQREVLIWSAKGESVRRIGLRLGLSPDTVREHLRNARQRYEANGGITLTVRALYDGDISFEDIAKR